VTRVNRTTNEEVLSGRRLGKLRQRRYKADAMTEATSQRFQLVERLRGCVLVPGDKSISHRALLLSALCDGPTRLTGLGTGEDVAATRAALRQLGVVVIPEGEAWLVRGGPWQSPAAPIDCGNSGTSLRLLTGALAAREGVTAVLDGDASLRRRPMARLVAPLRAMGATIAGEQAPLRVRGQLLRGGDHVLAVASAQVKTALLLAGLSADGPTRLREPRQSRDHGERMLQAFGAPIQFDGEAWSVQPGRLYSPAQLNVPGDPSSAAFLVAAAVLHPDAEVTVAGVCGNPTRLGFVEVLRQMGADLTLTPEGTAGAEPVVTLTARSSQLRGIEWAPEVVPSLVDEVPILALCCARATSPSVLRGLAELRVKESDRLEATARLLHGLGARVEVRGDDLHIWPGSARALDHWQPGLDHRMALTAAVAGVCGMAAPTIDGWQTTASSFPGFTGLLAKLAGHSPVQ
jgi:3-phosphoshikimate 1-carboxyvinyltransferase